MMKNEDRDFDAEIAETRRLMDEATQQWDRFATGEYSGMAHRVNAAVAAKERKQGFVQWCRQKLGIER